LCQNHLGQNTFDDWRSFVRNSLSTLYEHQFMEQLCDSWKVMLTMSATDTIAIYDARTSYLLHSAVSIAQWIGESTIKLEYKFVRAWIAGLPRDIRMAITSNLEYGSTFFEVQRKARLLTSVSTDTVHEGAAKYEALKRKLEGYENKKHGERSDKRNKDISIVALAQRVEELNQGNSQVAQAQAQRLEDLNQAVCYVSEQGKQGAVGAFPGQGARTMNPGSRGSCFDFENGRCSRGASCRYLHDKHPAPKVLPGVPPAMPVAAAPSAGSFIPPFFNPMPPSTPYPGLHGAGSVPRPRLNLPADACINFAKGACVHQPCKFKHYPK
jgi:hypothetical protein